MTRIHETEHFHQACTPVLRQGVSDTSVDRDDARSREADDLNAREDHFLREGNGIIDELVQPKLVAMGVSPDDYHATVMKLVRRVQYSGDDRLATFLGIARCGINGTRAAGRAVFPVLLIVALGVMGCADKAPTQTESLARSGAPLSSPAVDAATPGRDLSESRPVETPSESQSHFQLTRAPLTGSPLKSLTCVDNSESGFYVENRRPTIEQFDRLADITMRNGGDLAVAEIADGPRPLAQIHFDAEPRCAQPTAASSAEDTLYDRALADSATAEASQRCASLIAAHRQDAHARWAAFRPQIEGILHPEAASGLTAFRPVIEQADAYFAEHGASSTLPIFVLTGDGLDTTHATEAELTFRLSRPNILFVNDSGRRGSLAHLAARHYTSFSSALDFIERSVGGAK